MPTLSKTDFLGPAKLSEDAIKFMNFYPFNDIETISPRPMLFITGDQVHSADRTNST